jgi:ATP-dependent RNA helicase DHX36
MRERIIETIMGQQVTIISGETGCGKVLQSTQSLYYTYVYATQTTQVPQFLLDHAIQSGLATETNIVCTQPRRISAISIAERVASERGEDVGEYVGYQIRFEKAQSERTRLLFCTTGVLLRRIQVDPLLQEVNCVILDEVHERSLDSDFLLIILRDLLKMRTDLKLVLMSATLNAEMFSTYFHGCPVLVIPGYSYPVEEFFLEDVIEATRYEAGAKTVQSLGKPRWGSGKYRRDRKKLKAKDVDTEYARLWEQLGPRGYSERAVWSMVNMDEDEIPLELIESLVLLIDSTMPPGAILIFLPGWEDISKLHDLLSTHERRRSWQLLALHSQLPTHEQKQVFLRPAEGTRKVW